VVSLEFLVNLEFPVSLEFLVNLEFLVSLVLSAHAHHPAVLAPSDKLIPINSVSSSPVTSRPSTPPRSVDSMPSRSATLIQRQWEGSTPKESGISHLRR
jgi:hypothetical protein